MGVNRPFLILQILPVLAFLPGCFWFTTRREADLMQKDVHDLQARMAKQEQSLDEKIEKLDSSLDRATKLLKVTNADLGTEVEKLAADFAAINGQVESIDRDNAALRTDLSRARSDYETRLAEMQKRLDVLEKAGKSVTAAPPPPDKDSLYESGQKKFVAGDFEGCRRDFRAFVQKFPQDERADDALFAIGTAFSREKDYEKAIAEFQRVIDKYGTNDLADDAFYQAGSAAAEMKWCSDAKAYLDVLLKKFPQSTLAKPAKQKLDQLKKQAKNPAVCQS